MEVGLPLQGTLEGKPYHLGQEILDPEVGIQHCTEGMPYHPGEDSPLGLVLVQDKACSLDQIVAAVACSLDQTVAAAVGIVVAVADCIDLVAGCMLVRQVRLVVVPLFHLQQTKINRI